MRPKRVDTGTIHEKRSRQFAFLGQAKKNLTAKTSDLARDKRIDRALSNINEATWKTTDTREQLRSTNLFSQNAPQLKLAFIKRVSDVLHSLAPCLIQIRVSHKSPPMRRREVYVEHGIQRLARPFSRPLALSRCNFTSSSPNERVDIKDAVVPAESQSVPPNECSEMCYGGRLFFGAPRRSAEELIDLIQQFFAARFKDDESPRKPATVAQADKLQDPGQDG
jgi:hypothetical protein